MQGRIGSKPKIDDLMQMTKMILLCSFLNPIREMNNVRSSCLCQAILDAVLFVKVVASEVQLIE